MSKIKLTGSNSGYVEISSVADAGNLTLALPTAGTALLSNAGNVFTGITTFTGVNITDDITFNGASYNVVWDKSDNQLEFGDNAKISFGASTDFQIYHDSNNTHLHDSGQGVVYLRTNMLQVNNAANNQAMAEFDTTGVDLYSGNSRKFQTTNTGVVVTGICTATSFSGSGENLTRTTPYSHRNKFINGSFDIWQRGTSSTSSGYLADRWYFGLSGGSGTCSRQEHSGSQANFSGSQYYLRLTANSGGSSDYFSIYQRIEDVRTLPEGQITVSFWARGHVNGNLAVWMTQDFGSGGSSDVDIAQQVTPYLQNDTTFRYYSLTFTVPSISGKTIGAGSFFQISLGQGTNNSASGWTLDISNIQVEVGSVATPFENRSHGDTLMDCYRYYVKLYTNTSDFPLGYGYKYNDTQHAVSIPLPTKLRTTPTCSFANIRIRGGNTNGVNNSETISSLGGMSFSFGNFQSFTANTSSNVLVKGQTVVLTNAVSNNSSYINFDAEI
tara:strand:+ start:882 stop:2375 length:1494 start_codon:yes stop_codon:yes gene_type:complete